MKYIKAQLPGPGLSHDGKWAGLACVVAGYGYVVCVETRGIYWCIAMIDERGETKPPRQPRPESTGESSGHEPHKHTGNTHEGSSHHMSAYH